MVTAARADDAVVVRDSNEAVLRIHSDGAMLAMRLLRRGVDESQSLYSPADSLLYVDVKEDVPCAMCSETATATFGSVTMKDGAASLCSSCQGDVADALDAFVAENANRFLGEEL